MINDDSIVSLATTVTSGAIFIRWASGAQDSAFEDNPVINGFLEWMDAPEGQQSIEALDLVFDALEHAGVDARQRKIVWADGKRLSIEQSAERIHAGHPDVACDVIETSVLGWLESCTAGSLLRAPTRGTRPAHRTVARRHMSARHGPPESNRELGTLEELKEERKRRHTVAMAVAAE